MQDLLISSCLNDLMNCKRRFNVDIMMFYISGRDHARMVKFNIYVHLPSINKMFQYRYARMILLGVGEVINFEHRCYISALAHIRVLILSIYVLLEGTSTIYKYGHAWVIS